MITFSPGEKAEFIFAFTRDGEAATPQTPVQVSIKRAGGSYGDPEQAESTSDGVYALVTTVSEVPGLYIARGQSADGGIETIMFQVAED